VTDGWSDAARRRFLDERRVICERRMDTLHAPTYDERWGSYVNQTHGRCVQALIAGLAPGSVVLDAACGTGKYWEMLLSAGLEVVGMDQSRRMLEVATRKHPDVVVSHGSLQDLVSHADPGRAMDALLCIDAMENVGPEDWPGVVQAFATVLRPGAPAYVTVELPEDDIVLDEDAVMAPLVPGEVLEGGAYHFYPAPDVAREWLTERHFDVWDELEGDGYLHFLLRRR
jgi:SAM-dependent methyltransferase